MYETSLAVLLRREGATASEAVTFGELVPAMLGRWHCKGNGSNSTSMAVSGRAHSAAFAAAAAKTAGQQTESCRGATLAVVAGG